MERGAVKLSRMVPDCPNLEHFRVSALIFYRGQHGLQNAYLNGQALLQCVEYLQVLRPLQIPTRLHLLRKFFQQPLVSEEKFDLGPFGRCAKAAVHFRKGIASLLR